MENKNIKTILLTYRPLRGTKRTKGKENDPLVIRLIIPSSRLEIKSNSSPVTLGLQFKNIDRVTRMS